mmetsp:Transcript_41810/g.126573  ORF Transcript_41810/g.126573 Transcript_41810/m.126573 type:complete len:287 (-) Transcript_41810:1010-1870(-)
MVLVDQRKPSVPVANDLSGRRLKLAEQELQQSALASPVLADEHDARLAVHHELVRLISHTAEERLGAGVGEGHVAERECWPLQSAGSEQRDGEVVVFRQGCELLLLLCSLVLELLDLHPARAAARVARCSLPGLEVLPQFGDLAGPRLTPVLPTGLLLPPGPLPGRIAATGVREPLRRPADVQHVRAGRVYEITVMGNHQDRAAFPDHVLGQLVAQPEHSLHAQMVRGLVEHEDVRPRKEGGRQGHTHAPAAAERFQGSRPQLFGHAKAAQHLHGTRLRGVRADGL